MVIKENINIGSYVRQTYKKNINNIIVKKVGVARLQPTLNSLDYSKLLN
jgi:hypothetical protein